MKRMTPICFLAVALLVASVSFCQSVPSEVEQLLKSRERKTQNLLLLWRSTGEDRMSPEHAAKLSQSGGGVIRTLRLDYALLIERTPTLTRLSLSFSPPPSDTVGRLFDEGNFSRSWRAYVGKGWYLVYAGGQATVFQWHTEKGLSYSLPYVGRVPLAPKVMDLVVMSLLNPLDIEGARWTQTESRKDRWVLWGEFTSFGSRQNLLRAEVRKSDGALLRLEWARPSSKMRFVWRVERFRVYEGVAIPEKVLVSGVKWGGRYEIHQVLSLQRVGLVRELVMDLPLGVEVRDARLYGLVSDWSAVERALAQAVDYRWEGRLPSLEELKRLAYAQGNLLPPEAPRRRYSLVLFVPAVVLFLLAGYLYWKQRKK